MGKGVTNRAVGQGLCVGGLWLHAVSIVLPHPRTGMLLRVRTEPGSQWQALLRPVEPVSSAKSGWP